MKAPITKREEDLVHDFIVRNYLINVLENDLETIKAANFKIHDPYINLVETVLRKIRIDLRDIKAEMKRLQVMVTDPKPDGIMIQYDYYVRGYHSFSRYWDAALKMHGTKLLEEYFGNLQ